MRMDDTTASEVLQKVIGRLERIERADHTAMEDPLADAENCIVTMQHEAKAAIAELRPLMGIVERSQRYVSFSCARSRHKDCPPGTVCDCLCHDK
jgi:hypothetical protein